MNVAPHRLHAHARAGIAELGCDFAQRAYAAGLAVTRIDEGGESTVPIPVGALPVILEAREIARRAELAHLLARATRKAARWRLAGPAREGTLRALRPIERRLVEATAHEDLPLAVARVDFLGDALPMALEVNATIPAMQAYSDIAAEAWMRSFCAGHPRLEALVAANGSNVHALIGSLDAMHRQRRGRGPEHVGVLCRRGDAQATELRHVVRRMVEHGWNAGLVHPDQLTWRAGRLHAGATAFDLVYRHLFLSRLDTAPESAVAAAIAAAGASGTLVLNGPGPHLEMKSTLALLSQASADASLASAIGLGDDESDAVARQVPWTRVLEAPSTREAADLLECVVAEPDAFVLKRSWSYGGNEVFVGRARHEAGFHERARGSFPDVGDWEDLCRRAAVDDRAGGFVAQRIVPTTRAPQLVCTPDAVREVQVITDYAAFASVGGGSDVAAPWSGVCRASSSEIVNIVGGGGLVPLLRREVADALAAGLAPLRSSSEATSPRAAG
jgi:hypothetical protein